MKLRTFMLWSVLPVVACGLLAAQDPPPQDQPPQDQQNQQDPPSRVGRLNYLSGSVSFRPDNVEDWTAATLNYPLTTGDHLWTDRDSGAEIHIGSGVLHLADQTAFAVLNLDDQTAQFSLTQGAVNVNLPHLEDGETFEVDTPNGAVLLTRPGSYRVDVNGDANSSALVVRTGDAEVTGGGQTLPVHPRDMLRFSGSDQITTEALAAPQPDDFDRWCLDRDQREARSLQASAGYVPPEMVGAGDLANNGVWRNDPAYGPIWAPSNMPVGWEPYRYGHWAYVVPWGWTWIDDASWGFAPFHYGRWALTPAGWVWVPGTVVARPVYAPALVAFVGGPGFGMAIGVGGGGVAAWIPLGPHEVYRPYYRVSEVYVRNVNVTHVTSVNVVNVSTVAYVNRTHVVAVPQGAFVGARPVAAVAVRVPPEAIGRAEVMRTVAVRPVRESYLGRPAEPGRRFVAPPARVVARPVVVRQAPPVSVRSAGAVRVAAPARQPMENRPAVRADRPTPAYNSRPPVNAAPNRPAVTPQVQEARPRTQEAQPAQRPQTQQAQPPQRQQAEPQRQQQRQQRERPKSEKREDRRDDRKQ